MYDDVNCYRENPVQSSPAYPTGNATPRYPVWQIKCPVAVLQGGLDGLPDYEGLRNGYGGVGAGAGRGWPKQCVDDPDPICVEEGLGGVVYWLKVMEYEHLDFLWSNSIDRTVIPAIFGLLGALNIRGVKSLSSKSSLRVDCIRPLMEAGWIGKDRKLHSETECGFIYAEGENGVGLQPVNDKFSLIEKSVKRSSRRHHQISNESNNSVHDQNAEIIHYHSTEKKSIEEYRGRNSQRYRSPISHYPSTPTRESSITIRNKSQERYPLKNEYKEISKFTNNTIHNHSSLKSVPIPSDLRSSSSEQTDNTMTNTLQTIKDQEMKKSDSAVIVEDFEQQKGQRQEQEQRKEDQQQLQKELEELQLQKNQQQKLKPYHDPNGKNNYSSIPSSPLQRPLGSRTSPPLWKNELGLRHAFPLNWQTNSRRVPHYSDTPMTRYLDAQDIVDDDLEIEDEDQRQEEDDDPYYSPSANDGPLSPIGFRSDESWTGSEEDVQDEWENDEPRRRGVPVL